MLVTKKRYIINEGTLSKDAKIKSVATILCIPYTTENWSCNDESANCKFRDFKSIKFENKWKLKTTAQKGGKKIIAWNLRKK